TVARPRQRARPRPRSRPRPRRRPRARLRSRGAARVARPVRAKAARNLERHRHDGKLRVYADARRYNASVGEKEIVHLPALAGGLAAAAPVGRRHLRRSERMKGQALDAARGRRARREKIQLARALERIRAEKWQKNFFRAGGERHFPERLNSQKKPAAV